MKFTSRVENQSCSWRYTATPRGTEDPFENVFAIVGYSFFRRMGGIDETSALWAIQVFRGCTPGEHISGVAAVKTAVAGLREAISTKDVTMHALLDQIIDHSSAQNYPWVEADIPS